MKEQPKDSRPRLLRVVVGLTVAGLMNLVGVFIFYPRGMLSFSADLANWSCESGARRSAALGLVIVFSLVMWLVRESQRMFYGALECGFALQVAWFTLGQHATSIAGTGATLLGAVYVVVRGIDNLRNGWRDETKPKTLGPSAAHPAERQGTN